MAHFAKVENGTVTNVVVVDNEHEEYGQQYLNDLGLDGTWVQTSYNKSFRKKFAGIGDTYESDIDAFKAPKPYASWVFNEDIWTWEAPVPRPTDKNMYAWDEDTTSWIVTEVISD